MQFSNIIIPNKEYQKQWTDVVSNRLSVGMCSPFGLTAIIAAYTEGEEWLDQARAYIDGNIRYIESFVKENLPKAAVMDCQGTYLVWLDLNEYCSDPEKTGGADGSESRNCIRRRLYFRTRRQWIRADQRSGPEKYSGSVHE